LSKPSPCPKTPGIARPCTIGYPGACPAAGAGTGNPYQTVYKKKPRQVYYPTPNRSADIPPEAVIRKGPELEFLGLLDLGNIQITQGVTTFQDSEGASLYNPLNGNSLVGLDLHGKYRNFVPIRSALATINQELCLLRVEANMDETYRRLIHAGTLLNSIIIGLVVTMQTDPNEELGCLFYNA
jgi:hypothetical protein